MSYPTPRRLTQAREKGQIAKSMEVNTAIALLTGFWILRGTMERVWEQLEILIQTTFRTLPQTDLSPDAVILFGFSSLQNVFVSGAPFLFTLMAVGIIANLLQTRGLFAPNLLAPDLKRLNVLSGLQRLVSKQGAINLLKALVKVLTIGWMAYSTIKPRLPQILAISEGGLREGLQAFADIGFTLGVRVALVYIVLAVLDYVYEHKRWMSDLRMSKHEVKQDMKQAEGDPLLKGRIRQQQRRLARTRMFEEVQAADVVIINPTHLAVALRYDREQTPAPIVVAKGARLIAERIVALARDHGVPVIQNIPLARALYSGVELNQQIPADLFQAVAQVLAFVFNLEAKSK